MKLPASISNEAKSLLISLLNRNPNKRLGAGPTDAEEIKRHPFFDSVDWDKVLAKGYDMPKPPLRQINPQVIKSSIFEDPQESPHIQTIEASGEGTSMNASAMSHSNGGVGASNNNIPGWSFVSPADF